MKIQTIDYYNQYLEKVDQYKKYGYDIESARKYLLSKAEPLYGNILEIGTGKGYLTLSLARKGYYFTSIDVSPEEQMFACKILVHFGLAENVELIISDAQRTFFENNSFDVITSCNVLHHLKDVTAVMNEIVRVLKPQGKIILSDFNKEGMELIDKIHNMRGAAHQFNQIDFNKISEYLHSKGFDVEKYADKYHDIVIGCSNVK